MTMYSPDHPIYTGRPHNYETVKLVERIRQELARPALPFSLPILYPIDAGLMDLLPVPQEETTDVGL